MAKQGVMLRWKTLDILDALEDKEAKVLLKAIRQYAQYGKTPDFPNSPACHKAWLEMMKGDNTQA